MSFLSKQSGEADAFRGVHLDPNAHHWDEVSTTRFYPKLAEHAVDGRGR